MGKIYYWDSSVFCAFFSKETGRYESILPFLSDAESGNVKIVTSYVTITEVIKLDDEKPIDEASRRTISKFFERSCFEWVSFDREIAEKSRQLMWDHAGLKSKDAIHLASAISIAGEGVELDAVHAYDGVFEKLSGKVDDLRCPMGKPIPPQMQLDLGDKRKKTARKKRRRKLE